MTPKSLHKKVIIFTESIFNQRDYDRFGIEILKNRGFDIEIWDFTPIFREKEYLENYMPPDYLNLDFIFPVTDEKSFFKKINNLKEGDFVIDLYPGGKRANSFVYDALEKSNIHYGINLLGSQPELGLLSSIQSNSKTSNPFRILLILIKTLLRGKNKEKKHFPDFILCGGRTDIDHAKSWSDNTNLILSHAMDYDLFLNEKNKPTNNIYKDYAVFLDQYIPFGPDLNYNDRVWPRSYPPDLYYAKTNKFFSKIERDLGLEVIIASSPRANKNDYFEGRKVIREKTAQLVKHSNLVLAHYSISIGFAVLYKKPVIFMINKEYSKWFQLTIKSIAKALGGVPFDIEKNDKAILSPEINEKKYSLYKEDYIKMEGTPEKNGWEVFADYADSVYLA